MDRPSEHSLPVDQAQADCSQANVDVCRGRVLAQAMEAAMRGRGFDDDALAGGVQPSRAEADGVGMERVPCLRR